MNFGELRQRYINFFKSKGHTHIPSASLIPENDSTVLFTTAGMHPLVPYLLGTQHPEGKRQDKEGRCARRENPRLEKSDGHPESRGHNRRIGSLRCPQESLNLLLPEQGPEAFLLSTGFPPRGL